MDKNNEAREYMVFNARCIVCDGTLRVVQGMVASGEGVVASK